MVNVEEMNPRNNILSIKHGGGNIMLEGVLIRDFFLQP